MEQCKVYLDQGEEKRIIDGHPWIYNNEVARIEGDIKSGDVVSVFTASGTFIGQGFLNTASKIMVRMLTNTALEVDVDFFRSRLYCAQKARLDSGYSGSFRAFFAEADGIPGLVVDKYEDYLSVQFLTLGVDKRKAMFVDLLKEIYHPLGIYERSDVPIRAKEGLEPVKGLLYGVLPQEVIIREGNASFIVDIANGQKTGAFLDQSRNHLAIVPFAQGRKVLDCFSHDGNFAIQAGLAKAAHTTAIDISSEAIERIHQNAKLNNVQIEAIRAEVFTFLSESLQAGNRYDMIILDPPAFTKTANKVDQAMKGYLQINHVAMKLLQDDGILVSASCSQHIGIEMFIGMLKEAAAKASKKVQLVDFRIQSGDHPQLLGADETAYLKFAICRVYDNQG